MDTENDPDEYVPQLVEGGSRYLLIDDDGVVANVILWDGVQPYTPDEPLTLVKAPKDSTADVGDTVDAKGRVTLRRPDPVA